MSLFVVSTNMKPLLAVAVLLAAVVAVAVSEHHEDKLIDHTKHDTDHDRTEHHGRDRDHHDRDRDHHGRDRDHHGRDRDHHDRDRDHHGRDRDHHDRDRDHHDRDRDHHDRDHHDHDRYHDRHHHYKTDIDHVSDAKEKAAEDAAAAAAEKAGDLDHTQDFDELDDRIDALTARIQHINDRIDARVDPELIEKAKSLEARVVHIEGSGCKKREFQCGGDDPQCVGALLVCDGHKDCRNGEDEENCDLHFNVGDVFDGHVITDTCTQRQPDTISFEIKSIRRDTYFNTVAFMRININIEFENDKIEGAVSLPTVGYYNFGTHKLAIIPPESDRLGLICEFDGSDWDTCHGEIKHESSLHTCATLHFTRHTEDDDENGDDEE
jgi:hypothetical protein